ncbi:MAG TPA: hypothetical protein VFL80_09805 [Thermoanaerobaculia bacterium]|nr:hypothetical protein [Thermoanaerobaculia bacterium]
MIKRVLLLLLLLSLPSLSAQEAPSPADLERRIRDLEARVAEMQRVAPSPDLAEIRRQIDILTREIESLKTPQKVAAVTADQSQYGLGAAASKVYRADGGVSLGGYGEMIYQNVAGTNDSGARVTARDNADMLRAVLYAGYKFSDRVLFNSETEFEHGSTGAGGEVSVEFAYLDFLVRENMGIRAGLVLVPLGFVNEQHEPTAYLGSRRPLVERVVIPATWREMGVGAFGESGAISWRGYLVTGLNAARFTSSGIRSGRGNGAQSLAEDFALTGRVDWQPVVGATLGGAFYAGNSGQGALVNGQRLDARVSLYELHAQTKMRGMQLRGVWSRGNIADAAEINALNKLTGPASVGRSFGGWYAEAGYDLATLRGFGDRSLVPFVRYEKFNTQRSVPTGFSLSRALDQSITTLGVQWNPIGQAVIKADYQNVDNEARTGTNQWNVAVGYIF